MTKIDATLIVPCFNEALRIGTAAEELLAFIAALPYRVELVLVDDGSRDGTWHALQSIRERSEDVVVIRSPVNRGKGAAVRSGVQAARGDVVMFLDADLPYPLPEIPRAVALVRSGADVVAVRRVAAAGAQPWTRYLASRVFDRFVQHALRLDFPDPQCGFKAFARDAALALFGTMTVERFGFDVEIALLARRWGLRVERIEVTPTRRSGSTVQLYRDGPRMVLDVVRVAWRNARSGYPPPPDAS